MRTFFSYLPPWGNEPPNSVVNHDCGVAQVDQSRRGIAGSGRLRHPLFLCQFGKQTARRNRHKRSHFVPIVTRRVSFQYDPDHIVTTATHRGQLLINQGGDGSASGTSCGNDPPMKLPGQLQDAPWRVGCVRVPDSQQASAGCKADVASGECRLLVAAGCLLRKRKLVDKRRATAAKLRWERNLAAVIGGRWNGSSDSQR